VEWTDPELDIGSGKRARTGQGPTGEQGTTKEESGAPLRHRRSPDPHEEFAAPRRTLTVPGKRAQQRRHVLESTGIGEPPQGLGGHGVAGTGTGDGKELRGSREVGHEAQFRFRGFARSRFQATLRLVKRVRDGRGDPLVEERRST